MSERIHDAAVDVDLDIIGLRLEENPVRRISGPPGWFTMALSSSPGPLISDFVTHEKDFRYSTYGIHVGQDDRLTFMGESDRDIEGYFVDCREASPTLHRSVHIRFAPKLRRRLIVPRGVAHTFDNLDAIVTRDEPIWYSDDNNDAWNIDNDLISVPRDTDPDEFPTIRPNRHLLPDEAHLFMSRISQSLLQDPKSYLARYRLKIGGKEQYVMFESTSWAKEDAKKFRSIAPRKSVPGIQIKRSRYALTGPKSWTLVPSTGACVADVLYLPKRDSGADLRFVHARTRKYYTVLNAEGAPLKARTFDCRRNSKDIGKSSELNIRCDPRLIIVIEPGIAYSLDCEESLFVRCEHEIFADSHDPRDDIPMFGQDVLLASDQMRADGLDLPDLQCPDSAVYAIAKHESARSAIQTRT